MGDLRGHLAPILSLGASQLRQSLRSQERRPGSAHNAPRQTRRETHASANTEAHRGAHIAGQTGFAVASEWENNGNRLQFTTHISARTMAARLGPLGPSAVWLH